MEDFQEYLDQIEEDTQVLDLKLEDFIVAKGGSFINKVESQIDINNAVKQWKEVEGDFMEFFNNSKNIILRSLVPNQSGGGNINLSEDDIKKIIASIPFNQVLGKRLGDGLDALNGSSELKGRLASIKDEVIGQIPTGMVKILSDQIVSKLIDYVKNFNIRSNILVPLFLIMSFFRKTYVLNLPLLGAQQTALSTIKSMGPKFYNEFLMIFSMTKIKNFNGLPLENSFPATFTDWKTLDEIWKVIKTNLSRNLGSDLIEYINDPNNKKHFPKEETEQDINDIEVGMRINDKVKELLASSSQEGGSTVDSTISSYDSSSYTSTDSSSSISTDSTYDSDSSYSSNVLDTNDIDNLMSDNPLSSNYDSSTISEVYTEDIRGGGFLGLFMKPKINKNNISHISPVRTSEISEVSSVMSEELPKKGFFSFFQNKNVNVQEVSPVPKVNTSSLSEYFSPDLTDSVEFTTTDSSITNTDTEYLEKLYPEIFEKYSNKDEISKQTIDNQDDLFDSDIWISSPS